MPVQPMVLADPVRGHCRCTVCDCRVPALFLCASCDVGDHGMKEVRAFVSGAWIYVVGDPVAIGKAMDLPPHNCDAMGCGSADHIVAKARVAAQEAR